MRRFVANEQQLPPSDAGTHPGKRSRVFAVAIVLICASYYALTWSNFSSTVGFCKDLFCDFIEYYYPMGEAVFHTALPEPGYLYSPFIAIVLAGFPLLGLNTALVLWGISQALGIVLCLWLARRVFPAGPRIQFLFAAIFLSFFPVAFTFLTGQVSVFILATAFGSLLLCERGHRAGAAVLLALAVSFKFYPIIFLAPAIARRDWRFLLLVAVSCAVALLLIPAVFLGAGDTWRFYGALLESFRESDWVVDSAHSQYAPHVALRYANVLGYDLRAQLPLLRWLALGVAAANFGLIVWIQRARLRLANLWSFQLVFLSIPFVLKTSGPHDFVFLPIAQTLLAWWLIEGDAAVIGVDSARGDLDASTWRNPSSPPRTLIKFLLVPSIIISNIGFFNLFGHFIAYGYSAFLFWANLLLLIASYVVLLPPAQRRIRRVSC